MNKRIIKYLILFAIFIFLPICMIRINKKEIERVNYYYGTYTCAYDQNQDTDDCQTYMILKEDHTFHLYKLDGSVLRYGIFDILENNMIRLEFLDKSEIELIQLDEDKNFSYRCQITDGTYKYYDFTYLTNVEVYSGESNYDFYNNLIIEK